MSWALNAWNFDRWIDSRLPSLGSFPSLVTAKDRGWLKQLAATLLPISANSQKPPKESALPSPVPPPL